MGRPGHPLQAAFRAIGAAITATIMLQVQRQLSWPEWSFYPVAIGLALLLIVGSQAATLAIIHPKVGLDTEEVLPGVQGWELTAGLRIVPRWISVIGLFGICFLLGMPLRLLVGLVS